MRKLRRTTGRVLLLMTAVIALFVLSGTSVRAANQWTPANTKSNGLPYFLLVNRQANTVTVYTLDSDGFYSVPCKAMICSTGRSGHATPLFDTTLPGWKKRWCYMVDGSYGQYATQINGNYLFHSVCYYASSSDALMNYEYNALGSYASLGCIRLQVMDAKWIYDNCEAGTRVAIYDSPDPGPLGKPDRVVYALPDGSGWEPTDPAYGNPWKTVSVQAASGGTVSGGGVYLTGNTVTVHAVPDSGMRFAGWFVGSELQSSSPDYSFQLTNAISLTGRFAPQYQIESLVEGDGSVWRTEDFSSGYQLRLTASAASGSRFVGWYEGDSLLSGEPTLILTPSGNRTITARFERICHISVQASCSGTVTGGGDYPLGAEVTLTAQATGSGGFAGWYDPAGSLISYEAVYSFPASEARTLIAMFEGDGFLDVQSGDWYREVLYRAKQLGLVNGTAPFTYEPGGVFSRAMAAAMLSRVDGGAAAAAPNAPFTDVPDTWYTGAVNWAFDHGVILGTSDNTFSPDMPVIRQDFFTMVSRFLSMRGTSFTGDALPFHDADNISDYAEAPIRQLLAIGLIQGDDHGNIHPRDTMTRAEGAAVLVRLWDYLQTSEPAPSEDTEEQVP